MSEFTLSREQQLRDDLERTNDMYWEAQARLGSVAIARAVIMNYLKEIEYDRET